METDKVVIPKLTVKTLSDRAISIDLASEIKTIANIKHALEKHGTLPAARQTLLLAGRVLLDHEAVPEAESTIYLFFYEPSALLADPIEAAIDWDTKNRMKAFKGLYLFSTRRFVEAAILLIDALSTFSETLFIPFKDCVKYAAIAAMLTMDRPTILKKLVKSPEVLEVIHELRHLDDYINAFYNCRYREFFAALGNIESEFKNDWLIAPHTQYIIKEMRIRAYSQILQSYRSLTIVSMAQSFGVTESFIDRYISRIILSF
jgi:hypothetical protein